MPLDWYDANAARHDLVLEYICHNAAGIGVAVKLHRDAKVNILNY